MPSGEITHDALRALVLQLDPDDDEAEQKLRMALERRATRDIATAMRELYETLHPGASTFEDEMMQAEWLAANAHADQKTKDAIARMVQEGTDLGVIAADGQLTNIGFGVDWTLVNTHAREWAAEYTGQLIAGLDDVTVRGVRQATQRWIGNGEPLSKLIDDLGIYFDRGRAERIAATEVTRAYAEGNKIAYQESGVVAGWEWRTAADEIRCPTCKGLEGARRFIGQQFIPGVTQPPAHVNCRCWVVPWLGEGTEAP